MTNLPGRETETLLSIQYLRALAAIMVIVAHTFGGGGAQGVDIFFVISGFIMMHIMANRNRGALEFFLSRLLRIAPSYYIATIICLIVGLAYEPTPLHILHSALFLKLKWGQPVLSVGWTLEYEFAFYVCCALSLLFMGSLRQRAWMVTAMLLVLTFVLDVVLFPKKAYGHFLEFLMGMGIFFLWVRYATAWKKHVVVGFLAALLSFVSLFIIQYVFYPEEKLPLRFLGYGIPSAILVCSFLACERILPQITLLRFLGNASYSIYLTHTLTLGGYYALSGLHRGHSFLSTSVSFLLAVTIGSLFHLAVEKPLLRTLSARKITEGIWRKGLFCFLPTHIRRSAGDPYTCN